MATGLKPYLDIHPEFKHAILEVTVLAIRYETTTRGQITDDTRKLCIETLKAAPTSDGLTMPLKARRELVLYASLNSRIEMNTFTAMYTKCVMPELAMSPLILGELNNMSLEGTRYTTEQKWLATSISGLVKKVSASSFSHKGDCISGSPQNILNICNLLKELSGEAKTSMYTQADTILRMVISSIEAKLADTCEWHEGLLSIRDFIASGGKISTEALSKGAGDAWKLIEKRKDFSSYFHGEIQLCIPRGRRIAQQLKDMLCLIQDDISANGVHNRAVLDGMATVARLNGMTGWKRALTSMSKDWKDMGSGHDETGVNSLQSKFNHFLSTVVNETD
jgi:hypothetical protein